MRDLHATTTVKPERGSEAALAGPLSAALEPDGILAAYPGPLLAIAGDGSPLAGNGQAAVLAEFLESDAAAAFRQRVAEALGNATAFEDVIEIVRDGTRSWIEVTALPQADATVLLLGRSITAERRLRSALVESRQRYKDLVEASSDFAWETGADGRFTFVSPRGALGYDAAALVGEDPLVLVEDMDDAELTLPFVTRDPVDAIEFWCRRADGSAACLAAAAVPVFDEQRRWQGARGVCRDITAERQRDATLARYRRHEQTLAYVLKVLRDEIVPQRMLDAAADAAARSNGALGCCIFRHGPDGRLRAAARCGETVDLDSVVKRLEAAMAATPDNRASFEECHEQRRILACLCGYGQRVNGALCLWREPDAPAWNDETRALVRAISDQLGIALEQVSHQEELERLSLTDALTGLGNRRAFVSALDAGLESAERRQRAGALVYVDLDNFKLVNDSHGHDEGDAVLRQLGQMIKDNTRKYDHGARLGGDEFALWLDDTDEAAATKRAEQLLAAAAPLAAKSPNPERPLGLSIGIAIYRPGLGETLDDLLARADAAMYRVKRGGKGSVAVAAPATAAAAPSGKEA